jgi:hypothetical protein
MLYFNFLLRKQLYNKIVFFCFALMEVLMNYSQGLLIFIAVFFMKVFAAGTELTINTGPDTDLGEIMPPNTHTVPTNTPTLQSDRDDDEIAEIFTGLEDRNFASFKVLPEELSSSRLNNDIVSVAQSSAERIANRTPTPYFRIDEITAFPLNAAANPQPANAVSGWSWWYQWLPSFIS